MSDELSRHWRPYLATVVTAVLLVMGLVVASSERPEKPTVTATTAPVPAPPPVAALDVRAVSRESAWDVADQKAVERLAKRQQRQAKAATVAEQEQDEAQQEVGSVPADSDYSDVENCSDTSAGNFPTPPGDPNGLDEDGDGFACESN